MAYGTLYGAGFNSSLPSYNKIKKPTETPTFQSNLPPRIQPLNPLQGAPGAGLPPRTGYSTQNNYPNVDGGTQSPFPTWNRGNVNPPQINISQFPTWNQGNLYPNLSQPQPDVNPTQPTITPQADINPLPTPPIQPQRKNLDYWSFNAPPTSADRRFWYTPKSRGGGEFWRQQISNISTRNPYFVDPNQFNNPVNGMVQIAYDPIYPGSTGEIWVPLYVAQKLVSSTQPVISQPNPYENTNITTNTNPTIFA